MSVQPAITHRVLYGDRLVPCFDDCPENLDRMLARVAADRGDAPGGIRHQSHAELRRRCRLGSARIASGARRPGDRIGRGRGAVCRQWGPISSLPTFSASGGWGPSAVPIGTTQTATELTYMLNQSGASAVPVRCGLAPPLPGPRQFLTVRPAGRDRRRHRYAR